MEHKDHNMCKTSLKNNQIGLVSFVVVTIIMLVLSLIVIGFARLSRREQRQALDRQLSTQAFYAAESGINYAVDIIKATLRAGNSVVEKSVCPPDPPGGTYTDNVLDAGSGISFSCLLVNASPQSLRFDNISTAQSTVFRMTAPGPTPFDQITFNWRATAGAGGGTDVSGCQFGDFPPGVIVTPNCEIGVLRIDIVSLDSLTRNDLLNNMSTVFAQPTDDAMDNVTFAGSSGLTRQGVVAKASCNGGECSMTIRNIGRNRLVVRLKSIYLDSSVVVIANDATLGVMPIKDAQVIVDATGKANDILRRVQVRVPVGSGNVVPDFAIQTLDTLCKRLIVTGIVGAQVTVDPYLGPVDTAACQI